MSLETQPFQDSIGHSIQVHGGPTVKPLEGPGRPVGQQRLPPFASKSAATAGVLAEFEAMIPTVEVRDGISELISTARRPRPWWEKEGYAS